MTLLLRAAHSRQRFHWACLDRHRCGERLLCGPICAVHLSACCWVRSVSKRCPVSRRVQSASVRRAVQELAAVRCCRPSVSRPVVAVFAPPGWCLPHAHSSPSSTYLEACVLCCERLLFELRVWLPPVVPARAPTGRERPRLTTKACAARRAPRPAGRSLPAPARLTGMFLVRYGVLSVCGLACAQRCITCSGLSPPFLCLLPTRFGTKPLSLSILFVFSFPLYRIWPARAAEEGWCRWEGHLGRHHDGRRPRRCGHPRPQL